MFEKKNILGVGLNRDSKKLILEYIVKSIEKSSEKYYIVTPNPELLVIASRDSRYKKTLNDAKLALPDGMGVILASKLLKKGITTRITGVGLVNSLCETVAEKPITVGFLGGKPGVADKTSECLREKYPSLKVVFAESGNPDEQTLKLIKQKIDILFVAFGSPKQEIWISKHLKNLPVKIAIGVGGAFDFISGEVKRAPFWVRNIGLEWLFRLIIQPWRIKRQFSLLVFLLLILKEKFLDFQ
ncbi:MAG: WecB/TagA/CpsF family glycosyltransferase [Candidatus Levybacteria bacterium]|nr:WecB/TagA/CpsF family glycosyltransferase [Candidatus Levybacteria bacterium]